MTPVLFALFALLVHCSADGIEDEVKLEKATVVVGRTAELPCDISPPPLDSLYLVLWYKNDSDFPIYKYDARRSRENYRQQQPPWPAGQHETGSSGQSLVQQQRSPFGAGATVAPRVHFQFDGHPALLLVSGVTEADEGVYRCRVDFGRSPTRNVLVQLNVVVPPQKIRIIEDNREVTSVIGPYDEGAQLSLNCIVTGGRPRPEVSWWLDDKLVDHTYVATSENVVQNVLVIQRLERRHLHAQLRCQAANYFPPNGSTPGAGPVLYWPAAPQPPPPPPPPLHLPSPPYHASRSQLPTLPPALQHAIVSSVQLDLNLRPVWVTISGAEKPLSAGKAYTIECATGGSRPAANVHWYLHSARQPATERVSMDGQNTTSSMKITPTAKDHEADVICSAVNPLLLANSNNSSLGPASAAIETRRKLIVHFAPIAELELGRNLKPDAIVEGNDVYFDCRVRSNPPPSRIVWTHEGATIRENASAGVIVVDQSLVIRRVSRSHAGRYSCTAANAEGTGASNTVHLRVMYQPLCRPAQKTMYGVARLETATVRCQTDAIPAPHAYRWAFNTSLADVTDLVIGNQIGLPTGANFQEAGGNSAPVPTDGSVITYSPQSERDYGTLLCWARNEIGEQHEPCVYRIFLGVRPDPPSNCSVVNQTADSVEIWCRPGFDGGHPQQFQFEIFDTQSAVLLYNKSGRYPHLRVGNLESGVKLFVQISAFNQRGRSALVPLDAYTVKIADKQTVIMETTDLGSVLGIASGVSASVVMVCIAIGLTARFRHQQHANSGANGPSHHHAPDHHQRTAAITNGAPKASANNNATFTDVPGDEPDVILNNSGGGNDPSRLNNHTPANQLDFQLDTSHHHWNSTLSRRVEADVVPIVPNVQYYSQPSASASPIRTWPTLERVPHLHNYHPHQIPAGSVEVVTVKTPHRSAREVPETSI